MAMLPSDSELVLEVCYITAGQKLDHTFHAVAKGTLITAVPTALGGLILGPIGFLLGSLFGGGIAYVTHQPFQSVPEILLNLTEEEKQEFGNKIRGLLTFRNVTSVTALVASTGGLNTLMTFLDIFFKKSLKIKA